MLRKDGQPKKSGGKRPNSGKPALKDKKQQFHISFKTSIIDKYNGIPNLKTVIKQFIEKNE